MTIANELRKVLAALRLDPANRTFTVIDYYAQDYTYREPAVVIADAIEVLEQRSAVDCPACGVSVKQTSSATLDLALWQHWNWVCPENPAKKNPTG